MQCMLHVSTATATVCSALLCSVLLCFAFWLVWTRLDSTRPRLFGKLHVAFRLLSPVLPANPGGRDLTRYRVTSHASFAPPACLAIALPSFLLLHLTSHLTLHYLTSPRFASFRKQPPRPPSPPLLLLPWSHPRLDAIRPTKHKTRREATPPPPPSGSLNPPPPKARQDLVLGPALVHLRIPTSSPVQPSPICPLSPSRGSQCNVLALHRSAPQHTKDRDAFTVYPHPVKRAWASLAWSADQRFGFPCRAKRLLACLRAYDPGTLVIVCLNPPSLFRLHLSPAHRRRHINASDLCLS
jgi:hypothetical protein